MSVGLDPTAAESSGLGADDRPGGLSSSRRSVAASLAVSVLETAALVWAAEITGATALATQAVTSLADVAGSVFLLVGVVSSGRPADAQHPLGYGRERFFWSLIAAVGIFVGGFGTAVAETAEALVHPHPAGSFGVGYAVITVTVVLDTVALVVSVRPLRVAAHRRSRSLRELLWRSSDPAVTTVVLSSGAGVAGGLVAGGGLAAAQLTGRTGPDAAASAVIALILLVTSLVLLHTNRELLTGRGVGPQQIEQMRRTVLEQAGVLAVPDIFAVVVGPSSWIVDGDVVFDDDLDVPAVETVIVCSATALRRRWPAITYVYLNPVAAGRARSRRGSPPRTALISPSTGGPTQDSGARVAHPDSSGQRVLPVNDGHGA